MVNGKPRHVLGYLQDFLFHPKRAMTPVRALSGGERNRLLLARLFLKPSNLLILDEPTNDLDVETLELLEELIDGYQGTVMLVSHDRQFVDNTVTECWIFEGGGRIGQYVGGYHDARGQQAQSLAQSRRSLKKRRKSLSQKQKLSNAAGTNLAITCSASWNNCRRSWRLSRPNCRRCRIRLPIPISSGNRTIARSRCWRSWPKRSRRWKRPLNAGNISKD